MVDPIGISRFMEAISHIESGWSPQKEVAGDFSPYWALNAPTGAYGRFQMLPDSWSSWALKYLGNANAEKDGHTQLGRDNQNAVALGQMRYLYRQYLDWRRVAGYWHSGSGGTKLNPADMTAPPMRYITAIMGYLGFPPVTATTSKFIIGQYWYPCP